MTDKKQERPAKGTPEFKEWLKERAKKHMDEMFGENYKPAEFDERGAIFGKAENLDKTDAELFPQFSLTAIFLVRNTIYDHRLSFHSIMYLVFSLCQV